MFNLEKILLEEAVKQKFEYVIATAHPDNIASIKTIEKVGLELEKPSVTLGKYLRDIYLVKIL